MRHIKKNNITKCIILVGGREDVEQKEQEIQFAGISEAIDECKNI